MNHDRTRGARACGLRAFARVLSTTLALAAALGAAANVAAQAFPNPYRMADGWAKLPNGRAVGAVGDVAIDPDGVHVWAVIRCDAGADSFGWECLSSNLDSVVRFDADGNASRSFGGGMFIWPHGIAVDAEGNVWVTDAVSAERADGKRGHQVVKFSPDGKVLLRLGSPGVPGNDATHFNAPSDVAVAANGDVFVADGHGDDTNNRVVKFSKDGKFIKAWGKTGYAPGEFRTLHSIAIDKRGRVFVADRSNNRIQIFDQDGNFISAWTQFGKPSGISFDEQDRIYVADSESDNVENPGWEMGIRIGEAATGWVHEFILYPWGDPRDRRGNGAEFAAADRAGNVYAGEPRPRKLTKYVRVRP